MTTTAAAAAPWPSSSSGCKEDVRRRVPKAAGRSSLPRRGRHAAGHAWGIARCHLVVVASHLELGCAAVLQNLGVDDLVQHGLRQPLVALLVALHAVQDMRLERREELRDLAAAEAVQPLRHLMQGRLVHHLVVRQVQRICSGLRVAVLGAVSGRRLRAALGIRCPGLLRLAGGGLPPINPQWLRDVHVEVELHHAPPRVQLRQAKLDALVKTVEHRAVKIAGAVGRDDQHELGGGGARVVQDRRKRVAQLLAHGPALPGRQERVRLIDEQ
mmetsp:Transcript_51968/g.145893  ORF Transcript_51968/g.145893 Transcript_51968/m.145893 type:complete len:271 (-) Transcript_51968:1437-2249(-)